MFFSGKYRYLIIIDFRPFFCLQVGVIVVNYLTLYKYVNSGPVVTLTSLMLVYVVTSIYGVRFITRLIRSVFIMDNY